MCQAFLVGKSAGKGTFGKVLLLLTSDMMQEPAVFSLGLCEDGMVRSVATILSPQGDSSEDRAQPTEDSTVTGWSEPGFL